MLLFHVHFSHKIPAPKTYYEKIQPGSPSRAQPIPDDWTRSFWICLVSLVNCSVSFLLGTFFLIQLLAVCDLAFVFKVWLLVPDYFLEDYFGITFLPQKYWAVAIPIYFSVAFAIFIFIIYPSLGLLQTPSIGDVRNIVDEKSVYSEFWSYQVGVVREVNKIPPVCDIHPSVLAKVLKSRPESPFWPEMEVQSVELLKTQLPLDQKQFEYHLDLLFDETTPTALCPTIAKLLMNTSARGKYDLKSCDEFVHSFCTTTKRNVTELSQEEVVTFQRYLWQFYSNILVDRPTLQSTSWNNELFM